MSAREAGICTAATPDTRSVLRRVLVIALVSSTLVWASAAQAQVTPFGVSMESAANGTLQSVDDACVTDTVTVRNTGQAPVPPQHSIAFTASGPGPEWTVVSGPPAAGMQLAPGATDTFDIRLCPGDDVDDGATTTYTITATVTSDQISGGSPASATLPYSISASDNRLFGLNIPNSVVYIALAGIAALLALVFLTRSRGQGGVSISCPEATKTVAPGRGTSFPVRIRNDGRGKDVVTLSTSPVPPGWDTFLPLVDIPLEAREEQTVWLSVKSPEDAHSGDHIAVKVTARSSSAPGEQAMIDTMTTVRAPEPSTRAPPREEPESSVYAGQDDEPDEQQPKPRAVAVKRRKRG